MPRYEPRPQPYGYSSYQGGDRILDLIMRQGEIQAQGAQRGSEIWGQALSGIGQTLAGGIQQHQEQRAQRNRSQAVEAMFAEGRVPSMGELVNVFGPEKAPLIANAMRASNPQVTYEDRMKRARDGALGVRALPPDQQQAGWSVMRNGLTNGGGFEPQEIPEALDPTYLDYAASYGQEPAKAKEPIRGRPGDVFLDPTTYEQQAAIPAEPTRETRSLDVQAAEAQARGDQATYNRLLKVKKEMGQADDRPRISITTPRQLSQTAEAGIIQRLTTQWDTAARPAREIDRQVGIMEAGLTAARRGDVNAGSQAIIQTFNKILDTESAVREPEYLRSAEGQAFTNRIKGAIEKLTQGGAGIPVGELEKYARLARDMAASQKAFLPAMRDRIGRQADRYNIPQELIFEDTGTSGAPPPAAGPDVAGGGGRLVVNSPEEAARLPRGTVFYTPQGVRKVVP